MQNMYAIIDVETNGDGYQQEKIIDIAIYRFDGHHVTDQFSSLINAQSNITPYVQRLTSISPNMLLTAPKFHEVARRIVEVTAGATLVGHNISYDYRVLQQEFQRLGFLFVSETIDTIPLAKKLISGEKSYSLSKLSKSLGIAHHNSHRASSDALATLDLFKILMDKDLDKNILQSIHEENKNKTLQSKLHRLSEDVPNNAGILYLQEENGNILHTEFAKDMNRWLKSTFRANTPRAKELRERTHAIQFEYTGSALLADIILKSKNLSQNKEYPFVIFWDENAKWAMQKTGSNKNKLNGQNEQILLQCTAQTQAKKVLQYLQSLPETEDAHSIKNKLRIIYSERKLWQMPGRQLGEKAFFISEGNHLLGYGFYELYTQINTAAKIEKLMIASPMPLVNIENEMKLSLLKNEIKATEMPA